MIRFLLALPFTLLTIVVLIVSAPLFWLARLSTRTAIQIRGDNDMYMSWIDWAHDVVSFTVLKGGFPKQKRETVVHNVYCEAQGPKMPAADDHLTKHPPTFGIEQLAVFGDADVHGGRRVSVGGLSVGCPVCGAALRQFRVKS